MSFLPFCWLVPGDPGPFSGPFKRTFEDFDRFKKWFYILTSIKDPEKNEALENIVLTYKTIQNKNSDLFSINCIEANPKNLLHQRMRSDILNAVYKMKKYYGLPLSSLSSNDIIENVIGRILVYAHLNSIEYHKGFCELVMPIMHVYYYGVLQSEVIKYDMTLIEAIVADSFVRLMTNPIFNHLNVFPPSKFINSLLSQLTELIKPYPIYQMISESNIKPEFFASRWIQNIFTKDLDFSEAIKIWDYLFDKSVSKISSSQSFSSSSNSSSLELSTISNFLSLNEISNPINKFHQNIVLVCASCTLAREKFCKDVNSYEYLETIQEIDELKAEEIISQIENLSH